MRTVAFFMICDQKKIPQYLLKKTKKRVLSKKKKKARLQTKNKKHAFNQKKKSAPQARVAYKEHSLDT